MPNLQYSVPEDTYVEVARRAKVMSVSANQLAKAVLVWWLRNHADATTDMEVQLAEVLRPPTLPPDWNA